MRRKQYYVRNSKTIETLDSLLRQIAEQNGTQISHSDYSGMPKKWAGVEIPVEFSTLEKFDEDNRNFRHTITNNDLEKIIKYLAKDCKKYEKLEYLTTILTKGYKNRCPVLLVYWTR